MDLLLTLFRLAKRNRTISQFLGHQSNYWKTWSSGRRAICASDFQRWSIYTHWSAILHTVKDKTIRTRYKVWEEAWFRIWNICKGWLFWGRLGNNDRQSLVIFLWEPVTVSAQCHGTFSPEIRSHPSSRSMCNSPESSELSIDGIADKLRACPAGNIQIKLELNTKCKFR